MSYRLLLRLVCVMLVMGMRGAAAQTVQFGQTAPFTPPVVSGGVSNPTPSPGYLSPQPYAAPAPTPNFDPYAGGNSSLAVPRFSAPNFGGPATPVPMNVTPWPSSSIQPQSSAAPYPSTLYPNGAPAPSYGPATGYGGAYPAYPQASPGVLFPNGVFGPNSAVGPYVEPFRILQHPRFSDTWLSGGDNPRDLGIHDVEFAVTGALPQFLGTTQPLYVTPTFLLHLWDGPQGISADLPANAYSAFVDLFYATDPNRPLGAEIGVAVGAFTDFDTFNQHSVRVIGEGFGVLRLTPTLTFKAGIWYLNRNDLKLLPAGGFVYQPNAQTKIDLLFPNPKYSQYLTTLGNSDLWYYVAGEYGGGAWTIQRANGSSDRIDINDIRVKVGIDWINQRNWRGYFEVGYAFDRQVVYVVNPGDSFKARDTLLLGAGFSF